MIKLCLHDTRRMQILVRHVDDFLYWGTQEYLETVIAPIKKILRISSQASCSFKFIGLNVIQGVDEIEVDQAAYIDHLEPSAIDETIPNHRLLPEEDTTQLKSAGGQRDIHDRIWHLMDVRQVILESNRQLSV